LVGSEKFEAKRSEMKRKNNNFFSRERAKRMRNGSRFASFRFEAKKFLKRNQRTLVGDFLAASVKCKKAYWYLMRLTEAVLRSCWRVERPNQQYNSRQNA
jgi:hypothetical protein